jgi:hypothetical protein
MAIQVGDIDFNRVKIGNLSGGVPTIPSNGVTLANRENPIQIVSESAQITYSNVEHPTFITVEDALNYILSQL